MGDGDGQLISNFITMSHSFTHTLERQLGKREWQLQRERERAEEREREGGGGGKLD